MYEPVPFGAFAPNKHITTGEGGMIVTNNKYIANKCKSLRNICFNKHRRFIHYDLGWNYRFTNLQAAVGLAQLEKLDFFVKKKRNIGRIYNRSLGNGQSYLLPVDKKSYGENIYWVYGILLKNSKISVKKLMSLLKKKGIETRNFFWPLHQQPIFAESSNESLPVAEDMPGQPWVEEVVARVPTHGHLAPGGAPRETPANVERLQQLGYVD